MSTPERQDYVLGFRPTPALVARLEAARDVVARELDQPRGAMVTNQMMLPWLLNLAMDQLGIPRANGSESDALSANAEASR